MQNGSLIIKNIPIHNVLANYFETNTKPVENKFKVKSLKFKVKATDAFIAVAEH